MPAKSRTIGCIQLWEASMRITGLGPVSMITLVVALFAGAQDRGGRGGQRGGAGTPAMTMTIAGFPDGSYQISATGVMYRGPGAAANGPFHHYVFELFALDTKLDVQPTADAFETRANVIKAIQGHILAKAIYGGLFKRPQ